MAKTPTEHLVIIIDNNKVITPRKYDCKLSAMTKEQAVKEAKKTYENQTNNKEYEAYHFTH